MNQEENGVISEPQQDDADQAPGNGQQPGVQPELRAREVIVPTRRGSDYYDSILFRLLPPVASQQGFTLGVTGCGRRAGATTLASNLAIRAADYRRTPVLLVDANLDHPHASRRLRVPSRPGLAEALTGRCDVTDAMHRSRSVEGLCVMPFGRRRLLNDRAFDISIIDAFLTELRNDYATIVFDLPEAQQLRWSVLVAQRLESALLVVRAESTRVKAVDAATARLKADNVRLAGAVLTRRKQYHAGWLRR